MLSSLVCSIQVASPQTCTRVSDLQFGLTVWVIFNFFIFLSTQNDARTDLVQDQQQIGCARKSTHFHLDHLCTFVCLVVSMTAQSVGGDEISVISPVGMARAANPVGALEAGDLMGETPRGKTARYGEPAEQTPDQKAEEIVKKTLGSNLEKTTLEDRKRVVSKFFKLTNRLIRTREKYQSLVQQVQQIQRENVPAGVKPFSIPESEVTTKLERLSAERWCLNQTARGETRKSLFITSSRKHRWPLMRRWPMTT